MVDFTPIFCDFQNCG